MRSYSLSTDLGDVLLILNNHSSRSAIPLSAVRSRRILRDRISCRAPCGADSPAAHISPSSRNSRRSVSGMAAAPLAPLCRGRAGRPLPRDSASPERRDTAAARPAPLWDRARAPQRPMPSLSRNGRTSRMRCRHMISPRMTQIERAAVGQVHRRAWAPCGCDGCVRPFRRVLRFSLSFCLIQSSRSRTESQPTHSLMRCRDMSSHSMRFGGLDHHDLARLPQPGRPVRTGTCATTPANGARSVCSIFIASITARR